MTFPYFIEDCLPTTDHCLSTRDLSRILTEAETTLPDDGLAKFPGSRKFEYELFRSGLSILITPRPDFDRVMFIGSESRIKAHDVVVTVQPGVSFGGTSAEELRLSGKILQLDVANFGQSIMDAARNWAISPDGGSASPIRRGTAFFEARGCVNHLEFFLGRGVLALVGHHADHCATRGLPSLFHEQLQFLLALFVTRTLWKELFAGIKLIFSRIGEEPSRERILKLRRARGQECGED
jgi:hypothetical protein